MIGETHPWLLLTFTVVVGVAVLRLIHQLQGAPRREALPLLIFLDQNGGLVADEDPRLERYPDEIDAGVRSGLVSFGGAWGHACTITHRGEKALREWTMPRTQ